jgi:hypothetical protein
MKVIQYIKAQFSPRHFIGIALGLIGGYAYWYFYGCVEGCTITGSARNSTLYFGLIGYFFAGLFPSKVMDEPIITPKNADDAV